MKLRFYKSAHFLLFWLLLTHWIYYSNCYSMSFLPLYLSFLLDSLHHHPDSLTFFRIPTLIPCTRIIIPFLAFPLLFSAFPSFRSPIPILVFTDSLPSLQFLRICFSKIVALVQKVTFLSLLHNPSHQTPSLTSSLLSPAIIYLLVPQVKHI